MTRVVLYGVGTEGIAQHHQRDMYLPALRALGAEVTGLVGTQSPRAVEIRAAEGLAELDVSGISTETDLVIACPDLHRIPDLRVLLQRCAEVGVPVLLDKPTLLDTPTLAILAVEFPQVVSAHHVRFHPGFAAVAARISAGDLGLLHAVHGELLVSNEDGPHPRGEIRNLAAYCLDVVHSLIGELHGSGTAFIEPPADDAGESVTIALRCNPDVVVTLLVGRSAYSGSPTSVHRYRILGTHGQALVDLDGPSLALVGGPPVPFGPTSVERMITAVLAGGRRPDLGVAAQLAGVLDALTTAAADVCTTQF